VTSALPSALAFARHGHAVFPVNWPVDHDGKLLCSCGSDARGRPCGRNAAKHPYGKLAPRGLLSATTDAGIIKHWWGYAAPDANLGVVTDRLVVVDIDPRHDGDESFAALIREHGELPPTWRVLTGGGGEHALFVAPDGAEIASFTAQTMDSPPLGSGIDVRARGGYIVAPPSRHISGREYAWSVDHHPKNVALAPAPQWLIERLTVSNKAAPTDGADQHEPLSPAEWVKRLQPASEYPDDVACAIVGHLLAFGCQYQVVLGIMRPWARESGLDQQKLEEIVDRIARKEAAKRRKRLAR
jgi:Bifunctional DNA primase/polymerase, N-terminal